MKQMLFAIILGITIIAVSYLAGKALEWDIENKRINLQQAWTEPVYGETINGDCAK